MVLMRLKVEYDENILRYISVIRKNSALSIREIKKRIENNDVVLECDYFDTDELKKFKKTIDILVGKGAKVHLFQDGRELSFDYLNNLLMSYEQIEKEREQLDDYILD